jgi:hypothetical protein
MKIIDLLNKIANGEKVPKKIRITDIEDRITKHYNFFYDEDEQEYKDDELFPLGARLILDRVLNEKVEIIEENKKELHANNIEFNIYDDKKEFIITLDENDLGIDKLHLDNCYFYKENDKWYVKHINLKPIAYISQEHKIPEKICTNRIINTKDILEFEMIQNKINAEYTYVINEILDYLEEKE